MLSHAEAQDRLGKNGWVLINFAGYESECIVKCVNCGLTHTYKTFRNARKGRCPVCNDTKAHRGNQSLDKFNGRIEGYGWKVYGEYFGANKQCSFICLKCGNVEVVSTAKSIVGAKCKNCDGNICLNCGKNFLISNSQCKKSKTLS